MMGAKLTVNRLQWTAARRALRFMARCGRLLLWAVALVPWGVQAATAYSTPPGITLVEVVHEQGYTGIQYLWTRLGDEHGRTLFVSDKDQPNVSNCTGECSREFPPAVALPGSVAAGDWTLVVRADGSKQWGYKGKPLYRFARETKINEVVDNLIQRQFRGAGLEDDYSDAEFMPKRDIILPPDGWQVARFEPVAGMQTPAAINRQDIPAASALGLVDADGKTLYTLDAKPGQDDAACGNDCKRQWQPLLAGELSNPVGAFSLTSREDGTSQWVYRGAPLFTYRDDFVPGDVNGRGRGGTVAVLAQHFMPAGVTIREERAMDKILATADGLPLYSRYSYELVNLFNRREFKFSYRKGKEVGTGGCNAECLQNWRPLLAPADAQSQGFWEIFAREDGTRQWAYKGFAQYTYSNDEPNGGAHGHNLYDYIVGDTGSYKLSDAHLDSFKIQPMNIYWRSPAAFLWRVSNI